MVRRPEVASRVTGSPSTRLYIRPETMTDTPLFNLDAEAHWRLAYDRQRWVVQRRAQKPRVRRLEGHAIADTGWRGVSLRRRHQDDARAVISREGHRPDAGGTIPARRVARAVPGFRCGPGQFRRPVVGGGMTGAKPKKKGRPSLYTDKLAAN